MPVNLAKLFPVTISEDRMSASMACMPDGLAREPIAVWDVIMGYLVSQWRLTGVEVSVVEAMIADFNRDCQPRERVVIARGRAAETGLDGAIDWAQEFFNAKAPVGQDGHVDFYSVSTVTNVNAEDLLATVTAPTKGQPGTTVDGQPLPAADGGWASIRAGDGVVVREPGEGNAGRYYAERDGRVLFEGGVLSVVPVAHIDGDVDFDVGNIDFRGAVVIEKTVLDNFRVKAGADVTVGLWIQAAEVHAGGSVIVGAGIAGRGRGVVRAGRDVKAKYLNDATVFAGGDVTVSAESLSSEVVTIGRIEMGRSTFSGGSLMVRQGGEIGTLGANTAVKTVVHIGRDFFAEEELRVLDEEIRSRCARLDELRARITPLRAAMKRLPHEKRERLTGLFFAADEEEAAIQDAETRREPLHLRAKGNPGARLKVNTVIHPGVVISIAKTTKSICHRVNGPVLVYYSDVKQEIAITVAS